MDANSVMSARLKSLLPSHMLISCGPKAAVANDRVRDYMAESMDLGKEKNRALSAVRFPRT